MKIGAFGDLHLTEKKPKNRTDVNYLSTILGKIKWSYENPFKEVDFIVAPGDIFDSSKTSDYVKQVVIPFFKEMGREKLLVIYGQHDLRFHNANRLNTPLRVLEVSDIVTVLNSDPLAVGDVVDVYGASWGEDIPEPVDLSMFNILVIHKMVIKDEKLWEAQEGHSMARILLQKLPYDLIISGDNHQCFIDGTETKTLINMGSLMRSKTDQVDHRPSVAVFDTKTKNLSVIPIPVLPAEEVFDLKKVEIEKEKNEQLESFIKGLEKATEWGKSKAVLKEIGLHFSSNLETYISQNKDKISSEVLDILREATNVRF